MTRLILHADDLGLHSAVNRAVYEGAEAGVLTSASLMVNGAGADEALDWAKQQEGFGVGLHLNILRGRPLSDPADIPSLVDSDGRFLNSASRFIARGMLGRVAAEEVLAEYRLQLKRMTENGIEPTHFDGEKHSHLFLAETAMALARLMEESGIRKLRLINESALVQKVNSEGGAVNGRVTQKLKLLFLESRAKRFRSVFRGCSCPDYSFGVLLSGRTTGPAAEKLLKQFLDMPGNSTVEWMFHPGYPFADDDPAFRAEYGKFFLKDNRDRERAALLSPAVIDVLSEYRNQLISYREL